MQKQYRMRKPKDFANTRREGRSWANRTLVLIARPTNNNHPRFGFSVSKRVGNSVVRNRIKRRLREIARLEIAPKLQRGWDFLIIARKDAATADYQRLAQSLIRLFQRAKLLNKPPSNNNQHPTPADIQTQPTQTNHPRISQTA